MTDKNVTLVTGKDGLLDETIQGKDTIYVLDKDITLGWVTIIANEVRVRIRESDILWCHSRCDPCGIDIFRKDGKYDASLLGNELLPKF